MEKLNPQIKKEVHDKQEPKIEIDYNDYEYKWLSTNGFNNWIQSQKGQNKVLKASFWERQFLGRVDPKTFKRNVTRMYRVRALDFITNPDKPKQREFLKVIEDWYGKASDGSDIDPVRDHVNGVYTEYRAVNGEPKPTGNLIYYIPFTKTNVDEWIDRTWTTDKETIKFVVDTKQANRRKEFSYDDFVNLKWDELVKKIDVKPTDSNNVMVSQLMEVVQKQQQQIEQLLKKGK